MILVMLLYALPIAAILILLATESSRAFLRWLRGPTDQDARTTSAPSTIIENRGDADVFLGGTIEAEPGHSSVTPEPAKFVVIPVERGFDKIAKLHDIVKELGGVICGGYARYCASIHDEPAEAGDIDVYSVDDAAFDAIKSALIKAGFPLDREGEVASTFKHDPPIQLIKPMDEGHLVTRGDAAKVIANFDFTVARVAILNKYVALADPDFESHEADMKLVIRNVHCPITSLLRTIKYGKKGYFLPAAEAIKLFVDWEGRADTYRAKLLQLLESRDELSPEETEELYSLMRID